MSDPNWWNAAPGELYGDDFDFGGEEEPDDDCLPCTLCGCLIGDEVAYGDNYGEGPICANCIRPWPDDDEETCVKT
jgi:hypothetical protein